MPVRRGDIVLLRFPFSTGAGSKVRPAVVIQCDRNNGRLANTIVAMITSATPHAAEPTQLLIDLTTPEGRQSGLLHTSVVKCENLFTVHQGEMTRTVGALSASMVARLNGCLAASLEL